MRILSISGSLRARSINTELLRAAAILAPPGIEILTSDRLQLLPYFNPDLDNEVVPSSVRNFRLEIAATEGILISSPEYAHGVPGMLKNALDWLVGDVLFYGKPVALFNASPRSTHAQASLLETLNTMSATLVTDAFLIVPLLGKNLEAREIASNPQIASSLCSALEAFVRAIGAHSAKTMAR
jgi:chromate reductase